jgi:succinate-semialdehyde dehydrogenase/glutarate-semialdehyde dehydrogenase
MTSVSSRRLAHSLSAETPLSSSIASQLRNPSLLQIPKAKDQSFSVFNPAHPSHILADIAVQDAMDARAAIERSQEALPAWKERTTAMQRSEMLLKWSRLILKNEDDIANIMTLESGKPLAESRGELAYGRSFLDFFAGEAVRPGSAGGGFVIPSTFSAGESKGPRGQMMALYEAVGVTGLITPWNFPLGKRCKRVHTICCCYFVYISRSH